MKRLTGYYDKPIEEDEYSILIENGIHGLLQIPKSAVTERKDGVIYVEHWFYDSVYNLTRSYDYKRYCTA